MKSMKYLLLTCLITGCASLPSPTEKPQFPYRPQGLEHFSFAYPQDKSPLLIAVIDSGLNIEQDYLRNRILFDKDGEYGWDLLRNKPSPPDFHHELHGTLVASIIASYLEALKVPETKIIPIRYVKEKEGKPAAIAASIYLAIRHKAKIINLSSSGIDADNLELEVLKLAEKEGVLVVVAAGNDNEDTSNVYPCAYKLSNIICVGNGTAKGKRKTSNFGKEVSIMADGYVSGPKGYTDGSSFSAPQITAAAAFWWKRHPQATVAEVKKRIQASQSQNQFFSWLKFVDAYRGVAASE